MRAASPARGIGIERRAPLTSGGGSGLYQCYYCMYCISLTFYSQTG